MLDIEWDTQRVDISKLKPYEKNPRTITKEQYKKLKDNLKKYGAFKPMVATKDYKLIGGHQRLKALKELGINEISISVPRTELTEEQFKDLVVLDNISSGSFELGQLKLDYKFTQLESLGFDVSLIKEKTKEIKTIVNEDGFFVLVEFESEKGQEKFYSEMTEKGIKCKLMS